MREISSWTLAALLAVGAHGVASGQESASFKLNEHTLNAGGHPALGTVFTSPTFKVSLDSLGEGIVGTGPTSASFTMSGSFASAYPPPGEVSALTFTSKTDLSWGAEESTGDYNLYRSSVAEVVDGCLWNEIAGTTASDLDTPSAGAAYFYLVTAENLLGEEGTQGRASDGSERANPTPCP